MKKLITISFVFVLFTVEACHAGGFCTTVRTSKTGYTDIVTVPKGQDLVILQINGFDNDQDPTSWEIDVNDSVLIPGLVIVYNGEGLFSHDFPDGCVVVSQNQVLRLNLTASRQFTLLVVGYYRPHKK